MSANPARALLLGWLCLAGGCRFGGGSGVSGDPLAIDEPAMSEDASTEPANGGGSAATPPSPGSGGTSAPAPDASRPTPDAREPAETDASALHPDAATKPAAPSDVDGSSASGACTRPDVAVCDPVTNRGCDPPLQCIIDYASPALAGYCAFSTPIDGGPFCVSTPVTESCPPSTTCVDGECRTLCFCDDDCSRGECCAEQVSGVGFKLCGAC